MIKIVTFLTGASILILEIIGVRLLTPSFGSSMIIWTDVISVFLGAMSMGYYVGGWVADRFPRRSVLAILVAISALAILSSSLLARPVTHLLEALRWGKFLPPLFASFLLFFLPCLLLATVSPFAIKLETRDLNGVGRTSGLLIAISTAGSILGTLSVPLLITYLSLPIILTCVSFVLILISAVLLWMSMTDRTKPD